MFRISEDLRSQPRVLRLEGRLLAPWLAEVQRLCDEVRRVTPTVVLDLEGLSYIESPEGIALIHRLLDDGATLRGASPFVTEQLKHRFPGRVGS
ncbi:MAG TPA: hypothetical protein VJM11_01180 [Nevskiaceae bacterium]|nr:hypothetical protein [Nevskiaceae bacterium]